jgi:hypothetical protein
MLVFSSIALAGGPTGDYRAFSDCPYTDPAVRQCVYATIVEGEVAIGESMRLFIEKPFVLQGGSSLDFATEIEVFYPAVDGRTLSEAPQYVPGGLAGLLPVESLFQPPLEVGEGTSTVVTATPILAGKVEINASNVIGGEGIGIRMPIELELSNEFLGSNCYIGSPRDPIVLSLTSGSTDPPPPAVSIRGRSGVSQFEDEGAKFVLSDATFVDNTFDIPQARGCGGTLQEELDPIIDHKLGLPTVAGLSQARFTVDLSRAYAPAVLESAEPGVTPEATPETQAGDCSRNGRLMQNWMRAIICEHDIWAATG